MPALPHAAMRPLPRPALPHVLLLSLALLLAAPGVQAAAPPATGAEAVATVDTGTLVVDGIPRSYLMQRSSRQPAPLVLVLHGNTQQGRDILEHTSWPDVARRAGFVLVAPDGLNRGWADLRSDAEVAGRRPPAGTDDVEFLTILIQDLVRRGIADPHRIYVAGISNGGAMAMTLACERPDLIAAASSTIMALTRHMAAACHPAQGTPLVLMNGTADPLVNFDGGRGSNRMMGVSGLLSAEDTLRFWRRLDGCAPEDAGTTALADVAPDDGSRVVRVDSRCPPGTGVLLYKVDGGGHRMPDLLADARHPALVDRLLGPQNRDIDGPQRIWDFLKQYARP
ncbi:alpha/beta hydrolase family esterase [Thermomonas haemolytica]|uniref:Polyhydroxybutyrate depolymerase n=1 Tax=Thermomonas haemolytica TaxID=141949 RepID=A0A4R3NFZ3_9GAMM|nr:PHB depolymerase family esterase [Thermomonas haemolytica]TCT26153.1 polyhydroxybutyrate depolymerase [Thermomonas haemolytica]